MRARAILVLAAGCLWGCPQPPDDGTGPNGSGRGTGGEDTRTVEAAFAPSPVTPLAERAASEVPAEASAFAFLLRADVAVAPEDGSPAWYRVGLFLDGEALRLFELAPRAIGSPDHGQAQDELDADGAAVLAAIEAAGRGELPLLSSEECGGAPFCEPLATLAAEAADPAATLGAGTLTRVAVEARAVLARDAAGRVHVLDLTVPGTSGGMVRVGTVSGSPGGAGPR